MAQIELTKGEQVLSEELSTEYNVHLQVFDDGPVGWIAKSFYTVRRVGWGNSPREAVQDLLGIKVK